MIFARLASFIREYSIAIISFLLLFILTLFVYTETKHRAEERSERMFNMKAAQATEAIGLRMRDYVQILIGAKALFIASDTVERGPWHTYYTTLNLEENYPGIQGVGYTHVIQPDELEGHTQTIRKEGFQDYKVHPEGKRQVYTSIIFIEPFNGRNLRAFGYDMFSEPIRRSAMQIARDTKQPAMSGKVRLVQETGADEQSGFLIYLPIYKDNADPESIQDRQQLIKGYVYSPFRTKDLMTNILGDEFNDVDLEVYDGTSLSKESILFSTDSTLHYHAEKERPYSKLSSLNIGSHTWRIYISAKPGYGMSVDAGLPYFILSGGSIMSFLMFFIVWSLSNTRRSNHLKQTITDNATSALFIMDRNGYCTFMNPAAEEMTGYQFEEIRKKPLHYMIHYAHPDGTHYPIETCPLDRALPSNNDIRAHEDVFIKKDGTFFNVTCAARPIIENGEPKYTIIEVRDITDEKRAQQAIVESEARFRTMADNAPVMIGIFDEWRQCIYVNKQWLDFTGISFEQVLNSGWSSMVKEQDIAYVEGIYEKAIEEAASFRAEFRMRRHDGKYRWIVSTGTPRLGAEGEFMGHICSIIDITEIKEAEAKVKRNAELLQKLFLEVPALVALVRAPDQQYVLVNPPYSKLYGERTLVGKTFREAHPELGENGFFERMDKVFSSGKAFIGKEIKAAIDKSGNGNLTEGYFNMVYQPLLDSKARVEAVLIFSVEVTELVTARKSMKIINEELSKKNRELIRINNDLDNFVYTASHDLKSPIANMEGLITLLHDILKGKLEAEDEQILGMVGNSINKLKQTISDLAEITKVQKELQDNVEPLIFEEILQDIKGDLNSIINESGAMIYADFEVKGLLYAKKNLRSIVYNFVSNAIKYRSPERQAEVRLHSYMKNNYVVLEVQDNGLGIKQGQQHKLFTMFKRLHSHVEGTGIGLYIVKRIIENNEGRIEVESEEGKGTTFRVYFKQFPGEPRVQQV
ncbi:histidine kinase [Pontibacter sp. SGAir0037]|nr:histidine kinase [Pontibacter sp. SGAir0037]